MKQRIYDRPTTEHDVTSVWGEISPVFKSLIEVLKKVHPLKQIWSPVPVTSSDEPCLLLELLQERSPIAEKWILSWNTGPQVLCTTEVLLFIGKGDRMWPSKLPKIQNKTYRWNYFHWLLQLNLTRGFSPLFNLPPLMLGSLQLSPTLTPQLSLPGRKASNSNNKSLTVTNIHIGGSVWRGPGRGPTREKKLLFQIRKVKNKILPHKEEE